MNINTQFTTGHCFLTEVFASFQGEGLFCGQSMTFIRFAGCKVKCTWCDTKNSWAKGDFFRCELQPGSDKYFYVKNPVSINDLNELVEKFTSKWISVTGGEPLEQAEFLSKWLPTVKKDKKLLLETNGLMPDELKSVGKYFDIISADIKLPLSQDNNWHTTTKFLAEANKLKCYTYVKVVVTNTTSDEDVKAATSLIWNINPKIPMIIQPVTSSKEMITPNEVDLIRWHQIAETKLQKSFIIPQFHKTWEIK